MRAVYPGANVYPGADIRLVHFATPMDKARYLDGATRLDALMPTVRTLASRLRGPTPEDTAIRIHRWTRDNIRYQRDPLVGGLPHEEFADSLALLRKGYGDCDDKARLFMALALAAGLEARIRPVFSGPNNFVHVQAEVRWPGSELRHKAQEGGWIVAELILRGVELGDGSESGVRDASGELVTT